MASTFTNLLVHIVFSTKNRVPLIRSEIQDSLYGYMGGIVRGDGGILLAIGGMPDHVHLLAKIKSDVAVAAAVKTVKAKSSKWLNEEQRVAHRFDWQVGYGAFSVSTSMAERVRKYILNQEEHHRKVSFQEEMVALLKRNGVSYDERYLLG